MTVGEHSNTMHSEDDNKNKLEMDALFERNCNKIILKAAKEAISFSCIARRMI